MTRDRIEKRTWLAARTHDLRDAAAAWLAHLALERAAAQPRRSTPMSAICASLWAFCAKIWVMSLASAILRGWM